MNEGAGGLNQTFEKIIIRRVFLEPDLLQNIVGFVILLLVPALEISAVKWVIHHRSGGRNRIVSNEFSYHSRNPLAFVHEGF